jgi:AraC-like DNA-binding protein
MKISSLVKNSNKKVYDLDLADSYSSDSQLDTQVIAIQDNAGLSLQCKLHFMPGFCVLHESIIAHKASWLDFSVSGEHILITLFYAGNWQISDQLNGSLEDCYAGMIKSERQTATRVKMAFQSGEQAKRLVLVLSAVYIGELLKNDSWTLKEVLLANTSPEVASVRNQEHYFIDAPVRNVLNDLLRADFSVAYKRPFFELKVKELLFMLHTQRELPGPAKSLPTELYRKLVAAKAFLISHFVQPPTIRQLSRIVLLNEFKLKQHFKESFGITIHAFIIRLKMEEAEKLLLENCTVGDIAAKTGYRSVSHFIETFKKHYGMTPKQAMSGYQFPPEMRYRELRVVRS